MESVESTVWFFVAMAVAGVVQGLLGFGFAIVGLAILAYTVGDVREANLLVTVAATPAIFLLWWQHRQEVRWPPVVDTLFGAFAGLPFGWIAYRALDVRLLTILTGLAILASCIGELTPWLLPKRSKQVVGDWSRSGGLISGFLAGVLATSVGVPGPPVVVYAGKRGWTPGRFKAFVLSFFCLLAFARFGLFAAYGYLTPKLLVQCLLTLPVILVGQGLGQLLCRKVDPKLFRRLTFGLLAASGVGMLAKALQAYVASL